MRGSIAGRRGRCGIGMRRMPSRAAHDRSMIRISLVAGAGGHPRRVCSGARGHYGFSGHDRDESGNGGQTSCQGEFERFHYSLQILSFVFMGRRMVLPITTAYPATPKIPRTLFKLLEALKIPQRIDRRLGQRRRENSRPAGLAASWLPRPACLWHPASARRRCRPSAIQCPRPTRTGPHGAS